MRLVLTLTPSAIEFTQPRSNGRYPLLTNVASMRLSARAGHLTGITVGEASSLIVELDNRKHRAANLIGQPLRARAIVYDDADIEFYAGYVYALTYGKTIGLTISA